MTGVALISFILLAVPEASVQVQLLVWIFVMRVMMIIASGISYIGNEMVYEGQVRRIEEIRLRSAADVAGLGDVDRFADHHLYRLQSPDR